jgi:MFS family permease
VLNAGGAAALGVGFVVMATAPSLVVAVIGSALAGIGNGVESVAARTTIQERTPDRWMARVMGLNEAITQAAPGVGIVLGGLIAALTGPRVAFAVAGAGSLAITGVVWVVLRPRAAVRGESGDGPPDSEASGTLTAAVSNHQTLA